VHVENVPMNKSLKDNVLIRVLVCYTNNPDLVDTRQPFQQDFSPLLLELTT